MARDKGAMRYNRTILVQISRECSGFLSGVALLGRGVAHLADWHETWQQEEMLCTVTILQRRAVLRTQPAMVEEWMSRLPVIVAKQEFSNEGSFQQKEYEIDRK